MPTRGRTGVVSPNICLRCSRSKWLRHRDGSDPTPLRSYTDGAGEVPATGATMDELLIDLDRRHPGLRFRVVDEQGRLRQHMRFFVNRAMNHGLHDPIDPDDEVVLMQALSGG
ncbi:MAG: MoaD/ThiS family protein [Acidimicrobiales bacterium]